MNEKAAKGIIYFIYFLFAMLFFAFASWKLDDLRTPRILCMDVGPGVVNGEEYDIVVPSEAVFYDSEGAYVYIVEDTKSVFYPLVGRELTVTVLDSEDGRTAVQGVYRPAQLIRFADRPLGGSTVPVALWEAETLEGRVEVVPWEDLDTAEEVLRSAAAAEQRSWEIFREEDRLVIENADQFTAQMVRAVLTASGVEGAALDYTWGPAVLAQSGRLWLVWAAALGLWLLWSLIALQARWERDRAQDALEEQYLGAYLSDASVRLLAEGILLAVAVILTAAALQWIWRAEIALPRDLLPEGSVFDLEHYRMWAASVFPDGWCSAWGAELAASLKRGYILALADCGGLTVCAAVLKRVIKGRKKP